MAGGEPGILAKGEVKKERGRSKVRQARQLMRRAMGYEGRKVGLIANE